MNYTLPLLHSTLFINFFIVNKALIFVYLGKVELVELDGPFVKISLKGRFWHKRSTVLARVGNYLKQRIPVSHFTFNCLFYN